MDVFKNLTCCCKSILGRCLPGSLIRTLCDITEGRFADKGFNPPYPLSFFTSGLCDNIIQDIIYTYLVLPNRINIPLVGETQLAQLRFPVPKVSGPAFNLLPNFTFSFSLQIGLVVTGTFIML